MPSSEVNILINRHSRERRGGGEEGYEALIEKHFNRFVANVNPRIGLGPATDPITDTLPQSRHDHMDGVWFRDNEIGNTAVLKTIKNLRKLSPKNELATRMGKIVAGNITATLDFMFSEKGRWFNRFRQTIYSNDLDSELKDGDKEAPEVHLQWDGTECPGTEFGKWDHNQPESWGDFLLAIGTAKKLNFIDNFTENQMRVIEAIVGYLNRAHPWRLKASSVWEGPSKDTPASRSLNLAIYEGVKEVASYWDPKSGFGIDTKYTIDRSRHHVFEDMYKDVTVDPKKHPKGADAAMLALMPFDKKLPFVKYVIDNMRELRIEDLPGAIRFDGDDYYCAEGETQGEARWFMVEPLIAIGFYQEATRVAKVGKLKLAEQYRRIAKSRLDRALEIVNKCGFAPELFIKVDLSSVRPQDMHRVFSGIVDGKEVHYIANRGLGWSEALMMWAISEEALVSETIEEEAA
jgi:hypothetical protein